MPGRRREQRVQIVLPVTVRGTDEEGHSFWVKTQTANVSRGGAMLEWLGFISGSGVLLDLEHAEKSTRFEVIWIGEKNSPLANRMGLRAIDRDSGLWQMALPAPGEDPWIPPPEQAAPPAPLPTVQPSWDGRNRRRHERHRCSGQVEIVLAESAKRHFGQLVDVSINGCYVQTATPPPAGSTCTLTLLANERRIQAAAEVRTSHAGSGMGLRFRDLEAEDADTLQGLLDELSVTSVSYFGEDDLAQAIAAAPAATLGKHEAAALEMLVCLLEDKGVLSRWEVEKIMDRLKQP